MERDLSRAAPERAKEVLSYFLQNPEGRDLEDVARWRMKLAMADLTFEHVRLALLWLVEKGFLIEDSGLGAATRFRLNQEREREAREFATTSHWQLQGQDPLMALARTWIDRTLLRRLKETPTGPGDQPGFTRSRESLEALLSGGRASAGTDVEAARRAAAEATDALTKALEAETESPLAVLYSELALTFQELEGVLLCLAPELDSDYQIVFGVLNDDLSRRTPTLGLTCSILGDPLSVRTELAASAGLTRWRLLESAGTVLPHGDDPMRLDSPLTSWLLGSSAALFADPLVGQAIRQTPWPGRNLLQSMDDRRGAERLRAKLKRSRNDAKNSPWLVLSGEDSDGWRALVEAAASPDREEDAPKEATPSEDQDEVSLARIVPHPVPPQGVAGATDWEEASVRIARAVRLSRAIPILDLASLKANGEGDSGAGVALATALISADGFGMVIAPEAESILSAVPQRKFEVERRSLPGDATLASIYRAAMHGVGLYLDSSSAAQAAHAFPLSLSAIHDAARLAALQCSSDDTFERQAEALMTACRRVASPELPRFARRVEPTFGLAHVILPKDRLDQLREIVAHVKCAPHVLNTWGFGDQLPYGRGVAALFSGPSGTGKTMAAQAIAHELGKETFVIDLSRVVSKYIGETEKFIDATFRDAQRAGAVLQIDEAESLFGRRSEVKDSHDRYANLEVAYLLQRMEAFDGVAILTTNLRQNVDQAFLRRLRFVIDFPKPDPESREKIWRQCLPKDAPAKGIDFKLLARRLDLTGGHIRQITIRAAFAAADQHSATIEMKHVVAATRAELAKLGMVVAERELAEWDNTLVA